MVEKVRNLYKTVFTEICEKGPEDVPGLLTDLKHLEIIAGHDLLDELGLPVVPEFLERARKMIRDETRENVQRVFWSGVPKKHRHHFVLPEFSPK